MALHRHHHTHLRWPTRHHLRLPEAHTRAHTVARHGLASKLWHLHVHIRWHLTAKCHLSLRKPRRTLDGTTRGKLLHAGVKGRPLGMMRLAEEGLAALLWRRHLRRLLHMNRELVSVRHRLPARVGRVHR